MEQRIFLHASLPRRLAQFAANVRNPEALVTGWAGGKRRFDSERRNKQKRETARNNGGHDTKFTVTWPVAWQRRMDQHAERFNAPRSRACFHRRADGQIRPIQ